MLSKSRGSFGWIEILRLFEHGSQHLEHIVTFPAHVLPNCVDGKRYAHICFVYGAIRGLKDSLPPANRGRCTRNYCRPCQIQFTSKEFHSIARLLEYVNSLRTNDLRTWVPFVRNCSRLSGSYHECFCELTEDGSSPYITIHLATRFGNRVASESISDLEHPVRGAVLCQSTWYSVSSGSLVTQGF